LELSLRTLAVNIVLPSGPSPEDAAVRATEMVAAAVMVATVVAAAGVALPVAAIAVAVIITGFTPSAVVGAL
jgi:hypothetical protein